MTVSQLGSPIPSTSSSFASYRGLAVNTASLASPPLLDSPTTSPSATFRPRIRRRESEASDASDLSREGSPPVSGPHRSERRRASGATTPGYDLPKALERSLAMNRSRSSSSAANSPVAPSPLAALSPLTPSFAFKPPSPAISDIATFPSLSPYLAAGPTSPLPAGKRQRNKKLLSLNLALAAPTLGHASTSTATAAGTRSCPPSPSMLDTSCHSAVEQPTPVSEMRSNLKGGMAMRRRQSIPRLHGLGVGPYEMNGDRRRADPVRLIGRNGEAGVGEEEGEFPYQTGPVEILPGVYLGSEQNARDPVTLRSLGIGYILNVAKEVVCPWVAEAVIEEEEEEGESSLLSAGLSASSSANSSPILSEASISPSSVATTVSSASGPLKAPPVTRAYSSRQRTQTLAQPVGRPFLIRTTASTPNLQASFTSPPPSAYPSSTTATAIPSGIQRFPPDSRTGRPALEYLHLPWGHDEDALVTRFPSAFAFVDRARSSGGRVLVHCQCGVSRSATAVIAYVMQEASKGVSGLESVKGMHDAYNWVKDRSGWITPNMSLLFQLREWENLLTSSSSAAHDDRPPPSPAIAAFASTTEDMDVDEPTTSAFGANRTASERRAAHRRTFSTELR